MAINLEAGTEERIHRQLALGSYSSPDELLTHALDLIEAEASAEGWLTRNMDVISVDVEDSLAQTSRGETYSLEEAESRLIERHTARAA